MDVNDRPRTLAVLPSAVLALVSSCSAVTEPTEQQMRDAAAQVLSRRRGAHREPNEFRTDSIALGVVAFEKLSCVPADGQLGVSCDCRSTTPARVRSNKSSAASQGHAHAAYQLKSWLSGGRTEGSVSTVSARFVESKGHGFDWMAERRSGSCTRIRCREQHQEKNDENVI